MRKLLPILKLLTETRRLRLYLFALVAISTLSSISEIGIFFLLRSHQTASQQWQHNITHYILTLTFVFAISKPIVLFVGAQYIGVLEKGLYLDACYNSLLSNTPSDTGDESKLVTDSLILSLIHI